MATVGISVTLADAWLNTLSNIPFTVPMTCVQLHLGIPGAAGTSNPSAVTARSQATLNVAADGSISVTGAPAEFHMTAGETLTHISVWSGFDGDPDAVFLWSAVIRVPKTIANGDTVDLNSCDLIFLTKAS